MKSDSKNFWPFDQPRSRVALTMRQVLDGAEPILLVSHETDDQGWQFIGASKTSKADSRLVTLEEMVKCDPTILAIAHLPPGWQATRTQVGGAWKKSLRPENPESAPAASAASPLAAEPPESLETDNPFSSPFTDETSPPPPAAESIEPSLKATITPPPASEPAGNLTTAESVNPPSESAPVENKPARKPSGISTVLAGGFLIITAAAMLTLFIQNHSLHAQLDQAKAQAIQLQTQLDHLAIPTSSGSSGLLVVSAIYGSGSHFKDVTDRVNDLLHQPAAEFYAKPDWLHADPTPGWNKELTIVYKAGGQRNFFTAGEGGKVSVTILLDEANK